MKKSFELLNIELSEAAIADAKNFGLEAKLEKQEDKTFIAFESKADYGSEKEESVSYEGVYSIMKSVYSEFEYQLKWIKEDLSYTRELFYKHMEGHLPSIKDVGKMQGAIDKLGLGDSYEVKKAQVYIQY